MNEQIFTLMLNLKRALIKTLDSTIDEIGKYSWLLQGHLQGRNNRVAAFKLIKIFNWKVPVMNLESKLQECMEMFSIGSEKLK